LHQTHESPESTAVYEFHPVELQHDVAILGERVSNLGMQSEDLVAGYDSSVTLNDQDLAHGATLQTQPHLSLLDLLNVVLILVAEHRCR
jgi:hypothetical protein